MRGFQLSSWQPDQYTLITGGSEGIGKALAAECAKRGYNLILAALPGPELDNTVRELSDTYSVKVVTFPADLSTSESLHDLHAWCDEHAYTVRVLINNVGIGMSDLFQKASVEKYELIMNLNVQAATILTRLFFSHLERSKDSLIINISSFAAFQSMPYKAVYAATKTYLLSFSRALAYELGQTGIHVSVVTPGPVITNARTRELIKRSPWLVRKTALTPQWLAHYTLTKALRGKVVIIPGLLYRIICFLGNFVPPNLKSKIIALRSPKLKVEM